MVYEQKKSAPFIEILFLFGNDLLDIVNNISFHKKENYFQKRLNWIVKDKNGTDKVLLRFDKTVIFLEN